mgnify:CR=1 FL=1
MVETANIIWADGPSGNPTEPNKTLIRAWGAWLENLTATLGLAVTATFVRGTKAQLDGTPSSNGQVGVVVADDDLSLRGVYVREGSVWVRKLDLPADAAQAAAIIANGAKEIAVDARDIALIARNEAVAAKNIAEGYASDAVSQGNVPIYGSALGMSALTIPSGINFIRTNGYAAADGRGAALYRLMSFGEPALPGEITSNSGTKRWALAAGQDIHVEMFGAVSYTKAQLLALNGSAAIDPVAVQNAISIQKALDFKEATGGGVVLALEQFYVLKDKGMREGECTRLMGSGVDIWEPLAATRSKEWGGTNFLMKGTGPKDVTIRGVTSLEFAGGKRTDGSNVFTLSSFTNKNAVGSTPATLKPLSVALMNKAGAHHIGGRSFRIVNWIGTDGISDWSNPASMSLGDNWDIGILALETEYAHFEEVQAVGGFREYGCLELSHGFGATGRSERNRFDRCKFQGRIGVSIRGPDRHRLNARTSTTATIKTGTDVAWPAAGQFRVGILGTSNLYTYTGLSLSGDDLTFTGVTPSPAAETIGANLRNPDSGFGFAGGSFNDCYGYGLDHHSGLQAESFGLADSRPLEMSGYPLRGIQMANSKFHSKEKALFFFFDVSDLMLRGTQVEGTGYGIATPSVGESTAAAPLGETRSLRWLQGVGMDAANTALFTPRTGFVEELQLAYRSDTDINANLTIRALRSTQAIELITAGGKINMSGSSASLFPATSLGPSLGTGSNIWADVYAQRLRYGVNGRYLTSGVGSPEGVLSGTIGCSYFNESNGANYRKTSGSGNTGWVTP